MQQRHIGTQIIKIPVKFALLPYCLIALLPYCLIALLPYMIGVRQLIDQ